MTNNNKYSTYKINNVKINSFELTKLEQFLENKLLSNISPQLITTFNLDFLRTTHFDNDFFNICNQSLLNLPDGYGIIFLIKKKYKKNILRITGNKLYPLLLLLAQRHNKKIAIIGGTKNVSKKNKQILLTHNKIPSENLLCISPEYRFEEEFTSNENIIKEICNFKPDIVLAALGSPRQEKWLFENMNNFGSKINVGIGATLDFFTGAKKRSPKILQSMGLEWLWRLLNEPTRLFRRYIINDLPFFIKVYFSRNN